MASLFGTPAAYNIAYVRSVSFSFGPDQEPVWKAERAYLGTWEVMVFGNGWRVLVESQLAIYVCGIVWQMREIEEPRFLRQVLLF